MSFLKWLFTPPKSREEKMREKTTIIEIPPERIMNVEFLNFTDSVVIKVTYQDVNQRIQRITAGLEYSHEIEVGKLVITKIEGYNDQITLFLPLKKLFE